MQKSINNKKNIHKHINREDIILFLANQYTNLPKNTIKLVVKHIFNIMTSTLANKARIELRGLGSFSTRLRSARIARNPKTGEKIKLPSRYVVHFKSGKELNAKINL